MRAYSSLAGHILGSHPEINGYYELHLDYQQDDSQQHQLLHYQKHDRLKKNSRFLFDKLLHNRYRLTDHLIHNKNNRILVSIRKPEATLKSILKLFRNKPDPAPFQHAEEVTYYYCERLDALAEFCKRNKGHYFYYDAEEWVQQPEVLLPKLQTWLGLSTELTEKYQQFSQTGKARAGDSSEKILAGEINKRSSDYSKIILEQEWVNTASKKYAECRIGFIENSFKKTH
jgi:hypothetical protein